MASLNKVFLLGNLTHDPDVRGLASGQSVCTLRLAVNRRYLGSNGQEQEETCFVDVTVWGKAANNCRQYLSKGSQVMVEGRLRFESWEDRNSGQQRSRLSVVAENVQFMNRRREGNGGDYGNPQPNSYPGSNGDYQSQGNFQVQQGYQASQNNYRQSAPPRNDAPPMPDAGFNGGANSAPEDDIPF
ncbi:MAG: single-stranded DNA-binding protein [Lentisphaeria bacterium]|nr:single-stranded DNA-binding protein [Lentisphaeria bacterium]